MECFIVARKYNISQLEPLIFLGEKAVMQWTIFSACSVLHAILSEICMIPFTVQNSIPAHICENLSPNYAMKKRRFVWHHRMESVK